MKRKNKQTTQECLPQSRGNLWSRFLCDFEIKVEIWIGKFWELSGLCLLHLLRPPEAFLSKRNGDRHRERKHRSNRLSPKGRLDSIYCISRAVPIKSLNYMQQIAIQDAVLVRSAGKFMTLRAAVRFALEENVFTTGKFPSEWENAPIVFIYFLRRTLQPVIRSNYRLGLINNNGLTTNWSLLHENSFSFTCTLAPTHSRNHFYVCSQFFM